MSVIPRIASLLLAAVALAATPAAAYDLADGKLDIGLDGHAGYGRTDGNSYATGNEEGQYDNTVLAVTVIGHPAEKLSISGRFDVESEGAEVDWAFAEWKVSDALRFRAGLAKHAFGNYGEILENGTLRPFFEAPASIYGLVNIVGEGYTGAGFTGFVRLADRWSLSYDLYGGELDVETLPFDAAIPEEVFETRELIGGRLSVETPVDGLTLRLSAYTGVEEYPTGAEPEDVRHTAAAVSAEYLGEALTVRAEYAYMNEAEKSSSNAAYVEAAWKFQSGFQVAGRVEGNWAKLDGVSGMGPALRHREAAVGLNYWFSSDFVLKAEYHLVDGNRLARAEEGSLEPPSKSTQLFFIGAQFAL